MSLPSLLSTRMNTIQDTYWRVLNAIIYLSNRLVEPEDVPCDLILLSLTRSRSTSPTKSGRWPVLLETGASPETPWALHTGISSSGRSVIYFLKTWLDDAMTWNLEEMVRY
ncbi:hypothetical protein PHMEG_0004544 [Phytophthora megakarya]|uniref:Uncharacterized protein n=1 Tax=Phytophthora megakarya TaxID=4795 RepID=A0A225WTK0_9STRA|nr:hypothetical protein PHMEG_0004544 [Phytophthora megakarya]